MQWLHEHGLIGNYDDYVDLPVAVLEDARLVMEGEVVQAARSSNRARRQR